MGKFDFPFPSRIWEGRTRLLVWLGIQHFPDPFPGGGGPGEGLENVGHKDDPHQDQGQVGDGGHHLARGNGAPCLHRNASHIQHPHGAKVEHHVYTGIQKGQVGLGPKIDGA